MIMVRVRVRVWVRVQSVLISHERDAVDHLPLRQRPRDTLSADQPLPTTFVSAQSNVIVRPPYRQ